MFDFPKVMTSEALSGVFLLDRALNSLIDPTILKIEKL